MYHVHPKLPAIDDEKIREVNDMIDRYANFYEKDVYHCFINRDTDEANDKTVKWCLDTAYNILSQYYPITKECKSFEFWKYVLDGERTVDSIHTDNDNGDDIHTFILYTRKDTGINGGNLLFYKQEYGKSSKRKNRTFTFYQKERGEIESIVRTETGTIVCIDGNAYHRPEMMSGVGVRSCIVLQFTRDKTDEKENYIRCRQERELYSL